MFGRALRPALEKEGCPHLAVLLKSVTELPAVLASFYALGASRRGWLVHRALPGESAHDREMLAAAGLDVTRLLDEGRLVIAELDPGQPLADYGRSWERQLEAALERGFEALWYSRFAVGGELAAYDVVLEYDRAWEGCFRGRQVVTLCPFVVGELDAAATLDRFATLAEFHDGVVVPGEDGFVLYEPA